MLRLFLFYLLPFLNSYLLLAYLQVMIGKEILVALQVLFLLNLTCEIYRFSRGRDLFTSCWKKRMLCLALGLLTMFLLSLVMTGLTSGTSHNQSNLLFLQGLIPWYAFLLFLILASTIEECLYRQLIWERLNGRWGRLLVTSFFFAFAHEVSLSLSFLLYFGLGLILGFIRQETDLLGAIGLHITWNLLLYFLLLLM
ncbi:TPA: CPBP family intramembrane metalloprotease [Streptococcus agalactiae]|nr:CPBP family intramembrane metalloprotease [Streptococcus agalactiae]